jgi:hypothetical protein
MTLIGKMTFTALFGASALALTSAGASARIVCNQDGDCWHVHAEYNYLPEFGLTVHPDNWRWRDGEHFAWREHEGRGYWRGGQWRQF